MDTLLNDLIEELTKSKNLATVLMKMARTQDLKDFYDTVLARVEDMIDECNNIKTETNEL